MPPKWTAGEVVCEAIGVKAAGVFRERGKGGLEVAQLLSSSSAVRLIAMSAHHKYVGEKADGMPQGLGVLFLPDGSSLAAAFEGGRLAGVGVAVSPAGAVKLCMQPSHGNTDVSAFSRKSFTATSAVGSRCAVRKFATSHNRQHRISRGLQHPSQHHSCLQRRYYEPSSYQRRTGELTIGIRRRGLARFAVDDENEGPRESDPTTPSRRDVLARAAETAVAATLVAGSPSTALAAVKPRVYWDPSSTVVNARPDVTREAEAAVRPTYSGCPPRAITCEEPTRQLLPLKSIRGKWKIRELYAVASPAAAAMANDMAVLEGEVAFRGFDSSPDKGSCTFTSDDGRVRGRGTWFQKPARLTDGQVTWSARWKLKFGSGEESTTRLYRADTVYKFGGFSDKPSMPEGEVFVEQTGPFGSLGERQIGTFSARLVQGWDGNSPEQGKL